MMGGTLYQDLPTEYRSETIHQQKAPYDKPSHFVEIIQENPLHKLLENETLAVNSYHHQAIKKLALVCWPMAISEDGLIEAICDPSRKFLWGVQWHPEFSHAVDRASKQIFEEFVGKCEV